MKNWLKIERIPGPLASSYEKATRLAIDIYYREVAEEIVSTFKQGFILDLGTGPGYLPIEIIKRSANIKIVGIDLSRKLIQMAQQNAQKAGFTDFAKRGEMCSEAHIRAHRGLMKGLFPNQKFKFNLIKRIPAGDDCCELEIEIE